MIRLYFVRHGIALDHAERGEMPDDSRPLTAKGRSRFRRAARAFARLGETLDQLYTSPLIRAAQTAEILAAALRQTEVFSLEALRPEVPVEQLLQELAKRAKGAQSIGLVGHDPQMTQLLAVVGDVPKAEVPRLLFKKGAIVRIDVGELPAARPSEPRWWLKPRSRMLAKGLPLRKPEAEKKPAEKAQAPKKK
jgi:phosphohistidine phosphatase